MSLNRLVIDVLAASASASASEAPGPPMRDGQRETAEIEAGARTVPPRALRLAIAANLGLVLLTAAAAVILVVLAVQRGL